MADERIEAVEDDDLLALPGKLMVDIFFFMFTFDILDKITECTNEYASQPWFTSNAYTGLPRNTDEEEQSRPKVKGWQELTRGELVKIIGIMILMGAFPLKRTYHYWLDETHIKSPFPCISDYCTYHRYSQVIACLTFISPELARQVRDATTDVGADRLLKFRWVYEQLLLRVQLAWNPEQIFAIDESMIASYSKYCGFYKE